MRSSPGIISVLSFPYDNQLEIRVSRGWDFNGRIIKMNIYHAKYEDDAKVRNLVKWSAKMNELVMLKRINQKAVVRNPIV